MKRHSLHALVPGLIALSVLIACQGKLNPASPEANVAAASRAVAARAERWFKAIADKDLETTLSFYAPDAQYLAAGRPAASTPEARRQLWVEDYALPGFSSAESTTAIEVARSGDLAFQRGVYTSTQTDSQGKVTMSTGKFLVVWKKTDDGTWKAIIDMDNGDQ